MKKNTNKVRAPFDLPPVAVPFPIQVRPRIAAVMELPDEDQGSPIEREAIHLIYAVLKQNKKGEYCFSIPHHYGLKDRERQYTEKTFEADTELQAQIYELIKKISDETKVPVADLISQAQNDPQSFSQRQEMAPYVPELLRISADKLKPVPYERLVATVHMRRVIPDWQLGHTAALHEAIYVQLLDFAEEERRLALAEDEPVGEAQEASTSSAESNSSDPTNPPIGMPSDMISSIGESNI